MKRARGRIVEAPAGVEFREDRLFAHQGLLAAGARRRKHVDTPESDAIVREAYRLLREENDRGALRRAAAQLGWKKYRVNRRGVALRLARVKELDWSAQELEILDEQFHLGAHAIKGHLKRAGFTRSASAIKLKCQRLRLTAEGRGYTALALARLCGEDGHKVIDQWIARGWLKAVKRGTVRTEAQGGDHWWIDAEDFREFVFARPEEIDLAKVEKWWFLGLVTDGAISR